MTEKEKQISFILRYFLDRSFGHNGDGNWYSYITEATTSFNDGMNFCDDFRQAFPGRTPDPNLIKTSARLSKLLRELEQENILTRWRLGNEQQCPGDPKWQYCYKLSQHIINAMKKGEWTPEKLAEVFCG